jgi:hypothetical protein
MTRRFSDQCHTIEGPAVVDEDGSTTVIEPGDQLTVDELGYRVMDLSPRLTYDRHRPAGLHLRG